MSSKTSVWWRSLLCNAPVPSQVLLLCPGLGDGGDTGVIHSGRGLAWEQIHHYPVPQYIIHVHITLHYPTPIHNTLHYSALTYTFLFYPTLSYYTLHYTALPYTTPNLYTLQYTTLHYPIIPYLTIPYATIHHPTLLGRSFNTQV